MHLLNLNGRKCGDLVRITAEFATPGGRVAEQPHVNMGLAMSSLVLGAFPTIPLRGAGHGVSFLETAGPDPVTRPDKMVWIYPS